MPAEKNLPNLPSPNSRRGGKKGAFFQQDLLRRKTSTWKSQRKASESPHKHRLSKEDLLPNGFFACNVCHRLAIHTSLSSHEPTPSARKRIHGAIKKQETKSNEPTNRTRFNDHRGRTQHTPFNFYVTRRRKGERGAAD